jgi:phospholipase A1
VPLNYNSMLIEGDGLYFAFTIQAWWQIYAENISKPFRETNYQPELFYLAPLEWHPFGGNTGFAVGIEHQSNGRAQNLSRSWNRVFANFLYEKNNFALSFRPWIRLSEDDKEFAFDPNGDDNPDIDDFLGSSELGLVYEWHNLEFSFSGRRNFSTNNGSAEFGFTFPLWGKLRGYATVFTGYGESLIDYNYSQTRFGLGIALNNVL